MTKVETKLDGQQFDIVDSGFFVLRTPVLPFDELLKWSDGLQSCEAIRAGGDPAAISCTWESEVKILRARLRELVDRPEVRQALFIASPSLEPSLDNWKRNPESKKGIQTERSLVRYFYRMCERSTPFGLFAGYSTGRVTTDSDSVSDLSLEKRNSYRLASRLDFDYLFALTTALLADPAIAEGLRYWPNSSLRRIGDVWHYVESRLVGSTRSHHLVKLYPEAILDATIEHARKGSSIQSLVDAARDLPEASEFSSEEIREFIFDLVRNGVLVSSLLPLVTGEPALDELINQLDEIPLASEAARVLRHARDSMAALDQKELGSDPAEYREIASGLEKLPATFDLARLFQVDMIKRAPRLALSSQVVNELKAAITLLYQIGQSGEPDDLRIFREAFVERYERAWVPLEVALDEESGIGLGSTPSADSSPLLRNLGRLEQNVPQVASTAEFDRRLKKAFESVNAQTGASEIVLDISDLPSDVTRRPLPTAFNLMATLVAPSVEALNRGDFRIALKGVLGPSGARLLGRFCQADRELEGYVRDHLRQEEQCEPEAVYAEVVHLPEGRIGNVLCRPVFRDYEIVYLGRSGAAAERQLPVSDLLVTVTTSGRILLYSQRLQKRVIPRLSNAHGYFRPTLCSVYRFLALLQHDWGALPSFSWGTLEGLRTLPRVRVGRVILTHAQWRLAPDEVNAITEKEGYDRFLAMQELRKSRGLPRWIVLTESDNSLPVDLDNPLSVDAFVHVLKRAGQAAVSEMYPPPEELCVAGPEGRFRHELVVPFVRAKVNENVEGTDPESAVSSAMNAVGTIVSSTARAIPPGGEWLYLKVYAGSATIDEILAQTLPTLLHPTLVTSLVSEWFFIRYADPHLHLRLRFHGRPDCLFQELLPLIHNALNPLVSSGRIWKIQLDTYVREIERYGGTEGMILSEHIFSVDSDAVLAILRSFEGDEGIDMLWRIALFAMDLLFQDFGFDLSGRKNVAEKMRGAYEREFGVRQAERKRLGDKFRNERNALKKMFENPAHDPAFATARQVLERRSARLAIPIQRLRALADSRRLTAGLEELVCAYNHLHVNRLLRMEQRAHELVLYDFLYRLYDGELSQQEKQRQDAAPV